jgi:hypothetical protein
MESRDEIGFEEGHRALSAAPTKTDQGSGPSRSRERRGIEAAEGFGRSKEDHHQGEFLATKTGEDSTG